MSSHPESFRGRGAQSNPKNRFEARATQAEILEFESAGYTLLRLPFAVKELFQDWLLQHFPDRKDKVLHRLEELRGGRWNDPRFGKRMKGEGVFSEQIQQLFDIAARKTGMGKLPPYSTQAFRRIEKQMSLF